MESSLKIIMLNILLNSQFLEFYFTEYFATFLPPVGHIFLVIAFCTNSRLQQLEKEKANRDKQIETLTEDLNRTDEAVAKLSKEKKNLEDALQEQINATQAEEDKVNNLTKAKKKLEETLHDVSFCIQ